jgi:hypothetical protein
MGKRYFRGTQWAGISDVTLATFYVFDKENAGTPEPLVQLASYGGHCGHCRHCGHATAATAATAAAAGVVGVAHVLGFVLDFGCIDTHGHFPGLQD